MNAMSARILSGHSGANREHPITNQSSLLLNHFCTSIRQKSAFLK